MKRARPKPREKHPAMKPRERSVRDSHHSTVNSTMPSRNTSYNSDGNRGTMLPDSGSIIAPGHHAGAGRPHNSPLMKLPMRPNARPGGTRGETKSITSNHDILRARANHQNAAITPSRPPWKDMPPSQIATISAGWAK